MRPTVFAVAFVVTAIFRSTATSAAPQKVASEIQNVLSAQQDAWNRGDVEQFMSGYWRSDQTVFISDEVARGWQKVLDRYKRKYSDRAKMGTLIFSDL